MMVGNGPQNGFRVPPRGVTDIRAIAGEVGRVMAVDLHNGPFDMGHFIEVLSHYGITCDVLERHEMPHAGVEACCLPEGAVICIERSVYERACRNDQRSRFTIIHELGHLILGHRRTVNREVSQQVLKTYEDSEWQADQFAGEFLMPLNVMIAQGLRSADAVSRYFWVSIPAAAKRISQLTKRGEL